MSAIEDLLIEVRRGLQRITSEQLDGELASGSLVVDIRPEHYRLEEGEIPGAVVIERNVLEWRLDPSGPDAIPEADTTRRIVIVCNEGYASSLAANSLRQLGLTNVTDLDGGYRSWQQRREAQK